MKIILIVAILALLSVASAFRAKTKAKAKTSTTQATDYCPNLFLTYDQNELYHLLFPHYPNPGSNFTNNSEECQDILAWYPEWFCGDVDFFCRCSTTFCNNCADPNGYCPPS